MTANGHDRTVGRNSCVTSSADHAVTKVLLLHNIHNVRSGRLTVTFFYYKFPLDLNHQTLLSEQNKVLGQRKIDGVALEGGGNSAPHTLNSREYSFLLSRRLNWHNNKKASFDEVTEKLLDADVNTNLKDLQRSIQKSLASTSERLNSFQPATISKSSRGKPTKGTKVKGALAPGPSENQSEAREIIKGAYSPTPDPVGRALRLASEKRRKAKGVDELSAAPKLRKTFCGVGYVGLAWPEDNSSIKKDKIKFKIQLAEARRQELLKQLAEQQAIKNGKQLQKQRLALKKRQDKEEELALKKKLTKSTRAVKNLKKQVEKEMLEIATSFQSRNNVHSHPILDRPKSAPATRGRSKSAGETTRPRTSSSGRSSLQGPSNASAEVRTSSSATVGRNAQRKKTSAATSTTTTTTTTTATTISTSLVPSVTQLNDFSLASRKAATPTQQSRKITSTTSPSTHTTQPTLMRARKSEGGAARSSSSSSSSSAPQSTRSPQQTVEAAARAVANAAAIRQRATHSIGFSTTSSSSSSYSTSRASHKNGLDFGSTGNGANASASASAGKRNSRMGLVSHKQPIPLDSDSVSDKSDNTADILDNLEKVLASSSTSASTSSSTSSSSAVRKSPIKTLANRKPYYNPPLERKEKEHVAVIKKLEDEVKRELTSSSISPTTNNNAAAAANSDPTSIESAVRETLSTMEELDAVMKKLDSSIKKTADSPPSLKNVREMLSSILSSGPQTLNESLIQHMNTRGKDSDDDTSSREDVDITAEIKDDSSELSDSSSDEMK